MVPIVADGIFSTNFYAGSCIHTSKTEPGNWWLVDLEEKHVIQQVQITNRGDCCGKMSSDVQRNSDKLCHNL